MSACEVSGGMSLRETVDHAFPSLKSLNGQVKIGEAMSYSHLSQASPQMTLTVTFTLGTWTR